MYFKCVYQQFKVLLSAFKIGQNSHPADCLGKGCGFALSLYLTHFCLFEHLLILKETIRTFQGSVEKGNLRLLAVYLLLYKELCLQAEVCAGSTEFHQDLQGDDQVSVAR